MMRIRINGELFIAGSMYLLIIYLCLPIAMIYLNSLLIRIIVFVAAGSFGIGMVMLNKARYLLAFFGIFLFTLLFGIITWSAQLNTITYVYYCFASLTFVFGGMALYSSENEPMLKKLFFFLTAICFITSITTLSGLRVYPLAARELARGSTYDTSLDFTARKNIYRSMNIASWSQIYGMMFVLPTSLFVWKRKKHAFYFVLCIMLGLMLIASQITFAVLLAMVLSLEILVSQKNNAKTILISLFVVIVAVLVLINIEGLLDISVNMAENAGLDFLSTKLYDLKELLINRRAVGDASARGELYHKSIKTFLSNPLFGLMTGERGDLKNIGYHSDFFDMLGTFGLVGLMVITISIAGYFIYLKNIQTETKKELIIIFLGFILLFILNPVFNSPQVFAGAFLYPLLASRYCMMMEPEKNKSW